MKRTVERIVPLLPAAAAVVTSVCASSLLFTAPPQPVVPGPVTAPDSGHVGRVLAAPVPAVERPATPHAVAAGPDRPEALAAHARRAAGPAPPSHQPAKPVTPVPPSPTATAPSVAPPAPPAPARAVAQAPTNQAKPAQTATRPGWGHGDPNHTHAGPPGKGPKPKEEKKQAPSPPPTPAPAPPPVPEPPPSGDTHGNGHGNDHGGGKKSPGD